LNRVPDRAVYAATIFVFLALIFTCFSYDATATMWLDELHGYYVLQLGSISQISQALIDGVDNSAPIYLIICHLLKPVLGSGAFDLRFPSAAGFCIACLCIYIFLTRRLSPIYGLLGVLVLSGIAMYSIEGRPYGMAIGCVSTALVAWQSAAEQRARAVSVTALLLFLSLAISTHYWSIFVLPAIAVAEAVRWWKRRSMDLPIALAVTLPVLVLIPALPFIRSVQRFMPFFWSKPFFPLDSRFMFAGLLGNLPMLAVFIVPLIVLYLKPWNTGGSRSSPATLPNYEWALVTVIAVTPYALLIVALFTTRIFQDRYVVWSAFGITAFLVALFARYIPNRAIAVLACLIVGMLTADHWKNAFANRNELRIGEPMRRALADVPAAPDPIVIATHQPYMELAYYETPRIRARLVLLDNLELEKFYTASDTGSLLMSAVKKWTKLNIEDYCGFLTQHQRFLLAADAEDWLPWQLSASGYKLTAIRAGWHPLLFLVEAPAQPKTPDWIRAAKIKLTCSD
jgi:hypothetical protein